MTVAKVVLITKDERVMLPDFLTFYGSLFGYSNLYVVDNGSTDPHVLRTLERFARKGVVVRRDPRPFPEAVSFMSEHMASLVGTCTWLLPLETDEFMFDLRMMTGRASGEAKKGSVEGGGGEEEGMMSHLRKHVLGYLAALPEDVALVRYGAFYGSSVDPADEGYVAGAYPRPATQMTRFYDQGWDKLIVRADAFRGMTQWCHRAAIAEGTRAVVSDALGLLHYHETGFRRQVDSAVRVMDSFGYVDRTAPLRSQLVRTTELRRAGVSCGHKVDYYDAVVRRRLVLDAFRRVAGRLPSSAQEMASYADDAEVERRPPLALSHPPPHTLSRHGRPTWEELLYHEDARPYTAADIHVAQVADAVKAADDAELDAYLRRATWGALYASATRGLRLPAAAAISVSIPVAPELRGMFPHADVFESLDDVTEPESLSVVVDDRWGDVDLIRRVVKKLAPGGVYAIQGIPGARSAETYMALDALTTETPGIRLSWHDLRALQGGADDIVAILRRA